MRKRTETLGKTSASWNRISIINHEKRKPGSGESMTTQRERMLSIAKGRSARSQAGQEGLRGKKLHRNTGIIHEQKQ